MVARGKQVRRLAVAAVAVGVLMVAGMQVAQLRKDPTGPGFEGIGTGLTRYPGDRGVPLPEIEGRTIEGDQLSLRSLRGHVMVLNVWGSWCAPCRAEAPDLAYVSKQAWPGGVRFVGIDVRDNPAAGRAFDRRFGITYPSFDDQDGLVLAEFAGLIPVSAVPSTLVVDRQGIVRARVVGRVDRSTLRGLIEDAGKAA